MAIQMSQFLPALTLSASINCSFHEEVPTNKDAFALWTSLSTVFCIERK